MSLLRDESAAWPERTLYTHNGRWATGSPKQYGGSAIRIGDWKLVGNTQLYRIPDDPLEANNLFAAQPEIAQRLLNDYDLWRESVQGDIKINVSADAMEMKPAKKGKKKKQ